MSQRPSQLQTPSGSRRRSVSTADRRKTMMGPVGAPGLLQPPLRTASNVSNNKSRRQSIAVAPDTAAKPPTTRRSTASRKSMIPRVGRENQAMGPPPSPAHSVKSTHSSATNATTNTNTNTNTTATRNRRQSIGSVNARNTRRQSILPPAHSNNINDPRNVSDKEFQHDCVKRVYQYLKNHGYEHPLHPKTLVKPSAKDFELIVTFLLRQVNPMFQHPAGRELNFADEITLHFRAMGYPLVISKTALITPAMNYSSLLAALGWLVEQLNLLEPALPPEQPQSFSELAAFLVDYESTEHLIQVWDILITEYIVDAYGAFLIGNDEQMEHLKETLMWRFEYDNELMKQHVEHVQNIIYSKEAQMTEMNEELQGFQAYKNKRNDYQMDLSKFKDVVKQLNEHNNAVENLISQRDSQVNKAKEQSERLQTVIEKLKETIENQPLSVDDLQKLQVERKGIQEASERTTRVLKDKKETLLAAETEWSKTLTDLDLAVSDYNAKLDELALDWNDCKAVVQHQNAKDEHIDSLTLLGVDVVHNVPERIQKQTETLSNEATIKSRQLQEALDEFNNVLSAIDAIDSKLARLQQDAEKKRWQETQRKNEYLAEQNTMEREIKGFEEKVKSRSAAWTDSEYEAYHRQCTELEQKLAHTRLECQAKLQALHVQISQCMTRIKEHDALCQQKVQEVHAYWETHTSHLPFLKAP